MTLGRALRCRPRQPKYLSDYDRDRSCCLLHCHNVGSPPFIIKVPRAKVTKTAEAVPAQELSPSTINCPRPPADERPEPDTVRPSATVVPGQAFAHRNASATYPAKESAAGSAT